MPNPPIAPHPQGIDSYLESCGLAPAEINSIRTNLMTPDALDALLSSSTVRGGSGDSRGGTGRSGGVRRSLPWPAGAALSDEGEERVRAAVDEVKAAAVGGGGGTGGGKE